MSSQNKSQTQSYNQNVPQQASHSVLFTINHELQWIVAKIIRSSSIIKTWLINIIQGINHIIQKMKITIAKINNDSAQINKTKIGKSINQILFINLIFLNHIHKMNKHDKQDKTHHHIIINSNHKIL